MIELNFEPFNNSWLYLKDKRIDLYLENLKRGKLVNYLKF